MENNIVQEFEALTVYGRGSRRGARGNKMEDLVADLTLALEESGATAAVDSIKDGGLRRHPRKRRLRNLRRRSDPSIKAVTSSNVGVSPCRRRGCDNCGAAQHYKMHKKSVAKAASDLSESSMDELGSRNGHAAMLRRNGDSDDPLLLSLPFSSPSSSNPVHRSGFRQHHHHTANTTGTTPSVEQSVDPSDQSEDNEAVSLCPKWQQLQRSCHRLQSSAQNSQRQQRQSSSQKDRPQCLQHCKEDRRGCCVDDHGAIKPCESLSCRQATSTAKPLTPTVDAGVAGAAASSDASKNRQKGHFGAALTKDGDDFDVSTGTETFTPIRPHRRRRKMTRMSMEVTQPLLTAPSCLDDKSFSSPRRQVGDDDDDQIVSRLPPSFKQSDFSKSSFKKLKDPIKAKLNDIDFFLAGAVKRKRTVKDRRASENFVDDEDNDNRRRKDLLEKDDMEFSGDDSDLELSSSWSSSPSDHRGALSNDEGGDDGDDELSDWPGYDEVVDESSRLANGRPRRKGSVSMSPDWDDSAAMSIEDAAIQSQGRTLGCCKIQGKTLMSSDSATTIVQESGTTVRDAIPWWDNEDSNNSTIGAGQTTTPTKNDSERDVTLTNVWNGFASLGEGFEGTASLQRRSSVDGTRKSCGKRAGGMMKSPGAKRITVGPNQSVVCSRPLRTGRRRWSESRGAKGETRRGFSLAQINEKVNRFLQDQQMEELWLPPMTKRERDQIAKLASLYSLHIRVEQGLHQRCCPVLAKTTTTTRPPDTTAIETLLRGASRIERAEEWVEAGEGGKGARCVGASPFTYYGGEDVKRRRKTPPPPIVEKSAHRRRSPSGADAVAAMMSCSLSPTAESPSSSFGWFHSVGPLPPTEEAEQSFSNARGGDDGGAAAVVDADRREEESEDAGIDCGSDSDGRTSDRSVDHGVMKSDVDDAPSMQAASSEIKNDAASRPRRFDGVVDDDDEEDSSSANASPPTAVER